MPLARRRCAACTLPLGDSPHVPLPVRCARCGTAATASLAADGQPADFDTAFAPLRLAVLLEDATGPSAGCAACGAPTPPCDPAMSCTRWGP